MKNDEGLQSSTKSKFSVKFLFTLSAVAIVVAMALDTTVVKVGSEEDLRQQDFAPDAYGEKQFPRIQKIVQSNAVRAAELARAIVSDKTTAIKKYATMAGSFPVFPVKFEGTLANGKSGVFDVVINGLPEKVKIRVQAGPAINGTELRDIPGDIEFGAFTNQIEYQDAGAGINRAMSSVILNDLDRDSLTGKEVFVAGAFKMINPKNWLVTPVEFKIK